MQFNCIGTQMMWDEQQKRIKYDIKWGSVGGHKKYKKEKNVLKYKTKKVKKQNRKKYAYASHHQSWTMYWQWSMCDVSL